MLFQTIAAALALAAPALALSIQDPSAAGLTLDKRSLQREASARIALAKARAARKVRRAESSPVVERAFDSHLEKRRLPRLRCSVKAQGSAEAATAYCQSAYAARGVTYSPVASAGCIDSSGKGKLDLCAISCPNGYYAQTTDTSVTCILNANTCATANGGTEQCTSDPNGKTTCGSDGCVTTCLTRGYFNNPDNPAQCITSAQLAKAGCGPDRVVCPGAYNNLPYPPVCSNDRCSIECPRGFRAYTVDGSDLQNCKPN